MLFCDDKKRQDNLQKIIHLLPELDWALYEKEAGSGTFDLLEWLAGFEMEESDNKASILKATKNLDGVCAEEYSYIVGKMYLKDKKAFLQALVGLSDEKQKPVYEYVAHYCSYFDLKKIIAETEELSVDDSLTQEERKCADKLIISLNEIQKN